MLIFSTTLLETFRFLERNEGDTINNYVGLHVKYALFLSDLYKIEFCRQIVEKSTYIKFHENPSSGSLVVPCGRTDTTKLMSLLEFLQTSQIIKRYWTPSQIICLRPI